MAATKSRFERLRLLPVGYLKSKVYANAPNSLQDLRRNIEREIRGISRETRQKVMSNFVWRLQECVRMKGGHLEHVL